MEKQTLCRREYHRLKHSYHQNDLLTFTTQWVLKRLKSERNKYADRWESFDLMYYWKDFRSYEKE